MFITTSFTIARILKNKTKELSIREQMSVKGTEVNLLNGIFSYLHTGLCTQGSLCLCGSPCCLLSASLTTLSYPLPHYLQIKAVFTSKKRKKKKCGE